jgi:hypothetical protein
LGNSFNQLANDAIHYENQFVAMYNANNSATAYFPEDTSKVYTAAYLINYYRGIMRENQERRDSAYAQQKRYEAMALELSKEISSMRSNYPQY